ncbi:MAG: hypothetical protein NZM37_01695 [Sandaracinaceae bacterium]|nr:hypothetical protein [Sandaracinaceae bacterium]
MRFLLHLSLVFIGFLFESGLSSVVPLRPFVPMIALPFVLYHGVSPNTGLLPGSFFVFSLGVLNEAMSGEARGLSTFVFLVCFFLIRASSLKLLSRDYPFQIAATSAIATLTNGVMFALCVIFELPPPFDLEMPIDGWIGSFAELILGKGSMLLSGPIESLLGMFAGGIATGMVAPFAYAAASRIEAGWRASRHPIREG